MYISRVSCKPTYITKQFSMQIITLFFCDFDHLFCYIFYLYAVKLQKVWH